MAGIEPTLMFALQNRVTSDPLTGFEDADLFGIDLPPRLQPHRGKGRARAMPDLRSFAPADRHLDHATPGTVRNAVEIAVDRHHAIFADPALDGDRSAVGDRRRACSRSLAKASATIFRVVA